jgi:CelD/BcsL family acetyltransferase involved in cellulose biosynthesis
VIAVDVDPFSDARWLELVRRAPDGSVFDHPGWLALLRDTYRYAIHARCLAGDDGRLVAGLPIAEISSRLTGRRMVALPFSDLCPPLVADDAPADVPAAFASDLEALRRRAGVPLEVRGTAGVLGQAPAGARFRHHVLDLEPDVAAVERRFARPQVARGVRRARREGLQAEFRTDRRALEAFYRLHVATRRRLGVPTQPRRFIVAFESLFAARLGFVLLVLRDGRPIAAAVFLAFGTTLLYKYGASDARELRSRPNNLLFMEAIRWGCDHEMRTLDFGRTHWHHESLRAFKLAWGAEEREVRYRHVGGGVPGGRSGGSERLLGVAIRRSPPLVGRVIGEALYRHAG